MGKKTQEKRSENMRDFILETARTLMIEKGVKDTSLKDIAKAAKIHTGTLYYHFSAKEDIIFEIAEGSMRQITNGLLAALEQIKTDRTPAQVLTEVFERVLSADERGRLHLYLVSDAGTSEGAIAERFTKQYASWREALKTGLDEIRPGDNNDVLATMIIAILDGLIIQEMFGAANIPIADMLEVLLEK